MTALRILILTCDGTTDGELCDVEYGGDPDFAGSIDLLREQAEIAGWRHPSPLTDVCSSHAGGVK